MDLKLRDKVAIVVGAGGGGFGTGVCLEFAREGACVVANDIDQAWADRVANQVRGIGARCIATYADATKLEDCTGMVSVALAEFGRIDILVYVPAYAVLKKFVDKPEEEWHKEMDVTFWGAVHSVRAVLDPMLQQKSGSIVCVGSDAGKVGELLQSIYGPAKAAVMNFAKTIAKEHGRDGIRINVVSSGLNKTPTNLDFVKGREEVFAKAYPLGRLGEPQEMVDAIVFLASERASFITGQTVSVSGGYTTQ